MEWKILVITSQGEFQDLIRLNLVDFDSPTINYAASTESALAIARENPPALTILHAESIAFPAALVETLLALAPEMKLILVPPSNNRNHASIRSIEPDGYLSQPFSKADLLDLIKNLIGDLQKPGSEEGDNDLEEEFESLLQDLKHQLEFQDGDTAKTVDEKAQISLDTDLEHLLSQNLGAPEKLEPAEKPITPDLAETRVIKRLEETPAASWSETAEEFSADDDEALRSLLEQLETQTVVTSPVEEARGLQEIDEGYAAAVEQKNQQETFIPEKDLQPQPGQEPEVLDDLILQLEHQSANAESSNLMKDDIDSAKPEVEMLPEPEKGEPEELKLEELNPERVKLEELKPEELNPERVKLEELKPTPHEEPSEVPAGEFNDEELPADLKEELLRGSDDQESKVDDWFRDLLPEPDLKPQVPVEDEGKSETIPESLIEAATVVQEMSLQPEDEQITSQAVNAIMPLINEDNAPEETQLLPQPAQTGVEEDLRKALIKDDAAGAQALLHRLIEQYEIPAAIISKNNHKWVYSGELSQQDQDTIEDILKHSGQEGQKLDMARFLRLGANQDKFLLYAVTINYPYVLSTINETTKPLSQIRTLTLDIAQKLVFEEKNLEKSVLIKESEALPAPEPEIEPVPQASEDEIHETTLDQLLAEAPAGAEQPSTETEYQEWVHEIPEAEDVIYAPAPEKIPGVEKILEQPEVTTEETPTTEPVFTEGNLIDIKAELLEQAPTITGEAPVVETLAEETSAPETGIPVIAEETPLELIVAQVQPDEGITTAPQDELSAPSEEAPSQNLDVTSDEIESRETFSKTGYGRIKIRKTILKKETQRSDEQEYLTSKGGFIKKATFDAGILAGAAAPAPAEIPVAKWTDAERRWQPSTEDSLANIRKKLKNQKQPPSKGTVKEPLAPNAAILVKAPVSREATPLEAAPQEAAVIAEPVPVEVLHEETVSTEPEAIVTDNLQPTETDFLKENIQPFEVWKPEEIIEIPAEFEVAALETEEPGLEEGIAPPETLLGTTQDEFQKMSDEVFPEYQEELDGILQDIMGDLTPGETKEPSPSTPEEDEVVIFDENLDFLKTMAGEMQPQIDKQTFEKDASDFFEEYIQQAGEPITEEKEPGITEGSPDQVAMPGAEVDDTLPILPHPVDEKQRLAEEIAFEEELIEPESMRDTSEFLKSLQDELGEYPELPAEPETPPDIDEEFSQTVITLHEVAHVPEAIDDNLTGKAADEIDEEITGRVLDETGKDVTIEVVESIKEQFDSLEEIREQQAEPPEAEVPLSPPETIDDDFQFDDESLLSEEIGGAESLTEDVKPDLELPSDNLEEFPVFDEKEASPLPSEKDESSLLPWEEEEAPPLPWEKEPESEDELQKIVEEVLTQPSEEEPAAEEPAEPITGMETVTDTPKTEETTSPIAPPVGEMEQTETPSPTWEEAPAPESYPDDAFLEADLLPWEKEAQTKEDDIEVTPTPRTFLEEDHSSDILIDLLAETPIEPIKLEFDQPIYTCILVPELTEFSLNSKIAARIKEWLPKLSRVFGWQFDDVLVQPTYLQWTVRVPTGTSQGSIVRRIRHQTSLRIFEEFPEIKNLSQSGNFWAKGYLVVSGSNPPPAEFLDDFIQKNRRPRGILGD